MNSQASHRVNAFATKNPPIRRSHGGRTMFALRATIKKAERPLLVLGARMLVDDALEIAKAGNLSICATAHSQKALVEKGVFPESNYDFPEILNHLKNKDWKGVKGEGNHDLVVFMGFRSDLLAQGLSTLRHYAPHLKTLCLDEHVYVHADYSLPNFEKEGG